jgi:hypothetical protein
VAGAEGMWRVGCSSEILPRDEEGSEEVAFFAWFAADACAERFGRVVELGVVGVEVLIQSDLQLTIKSVMPVLMVNARISLI